MHIYIYIVIIISIIVTIICYPNMYYDNASIEGQAGGNTETSETRSRISADVRSATEPSFTLLDVIIALINNSYYHYY